mmetsp:Transcript_49518/g.117875  ORF Transcript_49518/g.117875 Transcript_49518/m.117875 type:complete len:206 (+) Transcript_49518:2034-2651(+)
MAGVSTCTRQAKRHGKHLSVGLCESNSVPQSKLMLRGSYKPSLSRYSDSKTSEQRVGTMALTQPRRCSINCLLATSRNPCWKSSRRSALALLPLRFCKKKLSSKKRILLPGKLQQRLPIAMKSRCSWKSWPQSTGSRSIRLMTTLAPWPTKRVIRWQAWQAEVTMVWTWDSHHLAAAPLWRQRSTLQTSQGVQIGRHASLPMTWT